MMETALETIREFADQAHGTQQRKYTPERYIVHPVRVMEMIRNYDATFPMLAAALLHDVLEDTPVKAPELLQFLKTVMDPDQADQTLSLVQQLTDVYVKSDYPQWNRRFRKSKEIERIATTSAEAQTIKYADILDNCQEIAEQDPEFAPKYLRECLAILQKAHEGNKALHTVAVQFVQNELRQLGKKQQG